MPWDWLNFRDPLKVNNPSEHGKNDAEHGEASSPPKAQWIDRLVGDGPAFDAAQEKYEKAITSEKPNCAKNKITNIYGRLLRIRSGASAGRR